MSDPAQECKNKNAVSGNANLFSKNMQSAFKMAYSCCFYRFHSKMVYNI